MAKGVEKLYYTESPEAFSAVLQNMKADPDTAHFFTWTEKPYYFHPDRETASAILQLHKDLWTHDSLSAAFSGFGQRQILQSFLLEEILSTAAIEQIFSTRHDIFAVLKQARSSADPKIVSAANGYLMLEEHGADVKTCADIRAVYDRLTEGTLPEEDRPDGVCFRKGSVSVIDGIRTVHAGFFPEEAANRGMEEFLALYNDGTIDMFERMILSHFLLETVHPYYDGNGRLGRFLFTAGLYRETASTASFLVSAALAHQKTGYYGALKEGSAFLQFGSLNAYFLTMCDLLHKEFENTAQKLKSLYQKTLQPVLSDRKYTKAEHTVLRILQEAALLSDFGVSVQEIIESSGLSRRTVISAMNRFQSDNLLEDEKFGKTIYHRLDSRVLGSQQLQ